MIMMFFILMAFLIEKFQLRLMAISMNLVRFIVVLKLVYRINLQMNM